MLMPAPQEIAPRDIHVWRFGGLGPWDFLKRAVVGWQEHRLSAMSAQFAYYSLLALVPLLILIIAAIARLPLAGTLQSFERLLRRALPTDAFDLVWLQIEDIQGHSNASLAAIATVVFIFGGMRLFVTLGQGVSAAFGTAARRHWAGVRGISFLLTLGVLALLLLALVLLVIGPDLVHWLLVMLDLEQIEGPLVHGVRWFIVLGSLLICTSAIYCLMPAVKLPWHWLSPGNVTAVGGWMLLSHGLQLYMAYFGQYNKTYGTLAGVVVLLLWFYLTGAMLMLGGLINGVIYQAAAEKSRREKAAAGDASVSKD